MSAISERYRRVREEVGNAADAVGRDPSGITIVAVSKTFGVEVVREAAKAGIRDFGENRAHEFGGKQAVLPDLRWHFVGTLQSRKARDVVGKAHLIHSVDRVKLLGVIERLAAETDAAQDVLLQVNVSGEESKHGFAPDAVEDVLSRSVDLPHVRIKGLMTMPPFGPAERSRPHFRRLAELFAYLSGLRFNGIELCELSMGMSNDYRVAVEEGATIVRVGQAIFGDRRTMRT